MLKKLRRSRAALVGVCCALVGAAAVPVISLAGSITGSTGDGPMVLQSGNTNLAYTGARNVSSFITPFADAIWSRVGDTVEMAGTIGLNPTTNGLATGIYLPLPIDSTIADGSRCAGTGVVHYAAGGAYTPAAVTPSYATGHEHECYVEYNTANAATTNWLHYTLSYRVVG